MNMTSMNLSLGDLEQAITPESRAKAAGEAKTGMEKVSKAFEESQPKALQMARKGSKPDQQGQFDRGMAQLGSLIQQLESQRPVSRQDLQKLGREALNNLQSALPDKGGSNEDGTQILVKLKDALDKEEQPLDVQILESVRQALQAYSVELSAKKENEEKPQMTGIDPNRLPPAYRSRIEKYFQKLSER